MDTNDFNTALYREAWPETNLLHNCTNCTTAQYLLNRTTSNAEEGFITPPPPYNLTVTITLGLLAAITSFCTTVGNIMVVISFVMEKSIRQPSNYLIASLAVTDILIGSLSMPLYTLYLLKNYWPLGQIVCDLWLSLDYTVCLVSQYTVFLITLDRFCSVRVPAKYRNWRTKNKIKVAIASTWIVPTLIFFTSILGWHHFGKAVTLEEGQCMAMFQKNELFSAILVISYYWVTLVVMIVLYVGIYKVALTLHAKAKQTQDRIRRATENGSHKSSEIRNHYTSQLSKDEVTTSSNNDSEDIKKTEHHDENGKVDNNQNMLMKGPTSNGVTKKPSAAAPTHLNIMVNESTALLSDSNQLQRKPAEDIESPVWKPRNSIPNSSIHWDAFSGQTHHTLIKVVADSETGSLASKSPRSIKSRRSRNSQNSDNYDSCSETSDSENTAKPKVIHQLTNIFQNITQQQKQPKKSHTSSRSVKSKSENRAKKALRTITFILGAFVICWTPYHVIVLVESFCKSCAINAQFYQFSYWLCYMNSPINPFCYALANQQFKKAFIKILKAEYIREWWRKRH